MKMRLFTTVVLAACALGSARADDADPPARAARLSEVDGTVSLQPAGLQDWTAATPNRPLTAGDRLWSDQDARAELDLGDGVVRLGSNTGFAFFALDDTTAQMQLTGGSLIVRVRDLQPNEIYEIDTPNLAVSLQQPGEYRVDVSERGDATAVQVADGAALVAGGGQQMMIGTRQGGTFSGTDALTYTNSGLAAEDGLDVWSGTRDEALDASTSAQYVAPDVPGTADLDNNGSWQQLPDYGWVWTPAVVVAGWAPYRFGRWLWVSPWGWTWVDDAPWGYAPFHYGRWIGCRNTWCWVPGPRQLRPVYAPAQVGWASGAATIGWFPLAPRELYVPAGPVTTSYLRRVNLANSAGIAASEFAGAARTLPALPHYLNARPAALSSVAPDVFTSGQRVSARTLRAPVGATSFVAMAPALVPTRQSVLGPAEGHGVPRPPPTQLRRAVVVRRQPPPAPVPFDKLTAAIQANSGRLPAHSELAQLQPAGPAAVVRAVSAGAITTSGAQSMMGLAERERLLEQRRLGTAAPPRAPVAASAPRAAAAVTASIRANAFVPPDLSEERVPAVPGSRAPSAPAGADPVPRAVGVAAQSAVRGSAAAPVAPPYRPSLPAEAELVTEPPAEAADRAAAPALPPPAAAAVPAAAQAGSPPPVAQSSARQGSHPQPNTPPHPAGQEARQSAPHADRESRERVLR